MNAHILFKGPGGPTIEQRFAALIGLFDMDNDGEVSKEETLALLSKFLCLLRHCFELQIDVMARVTLDGTLDPLFKHLWEKIFPEGLTREKAADIQRHPEHLVDPIREEYRGASQPPDKMSFEKLMAATQDRPETEYGF